MATASIEILETRRALNNLAQGAVEVAPRLLFSSASLVMDVRGGDRLTLVTSGGINLGLERLPIEGDKHDKYSYIKVTAKSGEGKPHNYMLKEADLLDDVVNSRTLGHAIYRARPGTEDFQQVPQDLAGVVGARLAVLIADGHQNTP